MNSKEKRSEPKNAVKFDGVTYNTKSNRNEVHKSKKISQGRDEVTTKKKKSVEPYKVNGKTKKKKHGTVVCVSKKSVHKAKSAPKIKKKKKRLKPGAAYIPEIKKPYDTPPTMAVPTSSCNFDVYLCRKRKKIVPKVVISKGNCDFMSDLNGKKAVFSVKCSSKSIKRITKPKKSKCTNTAGINLSINPCLEQKRKGRDDKNIE